MSVVIVGGGLGGLYSAYLLARAGRPAILLEATPRLGGRILSRASAGSRLAVDLGPTWFWPHQRTMGALLADLGIPWFEQFVAGDALYQARPHVAPERFTGAGAMAACRVRGGFQSVVEALAGTLDPARVRVDHPVSALERNDGCWRVRARHGGTEVVVEAEHLILAAPPRVLVDRLPLDRWLSAGLYQRLAETPTWMAGQAKFVASYERPFWREAGLSGDAFSRVGPLVEIHDASADADAGFALFGFVGVPAPSRLELPEDVLARHCLEQLGDLFGDEARDPEATYLKDWARDPWVATPRDLGEPSRHPELDLRPFLSELEGLNLTFAATEAAPAEGGLLEGALLAGAAAVAPILAGPRLGPGGGQASAP